MKRDELYETVTNSIISMMEQGTKPWAPTWNASQCMTHPLRSNGEKYQGINTVILWTACQVKGYTGKHWFTFKQALEMGASVRKGEKASPVVFFTTLEKETDKVKDGQPVVDKIPCLKTYSVFNACQIDKLPEKYLTQPAATVKTNPDQPIPAIDLFVSNTGVNLTHRGGRAYYECNTNNVVMPHFSDFHTAQDYYATLLHEMTHWTGHPKRIDRNMKPNTASYAFEELIAELGAAFLCADLGITNAPREDHASYLQHWPGILKKDNKAIFQAAAAAQKACNYLHNVQPKAQTLDRVAA
jgi:antirestriction protein ArdC